MNAKVLLILSVIVNVALGVALLKPKPELSPRPASVETKSTPAASPAPNTAVTPATKTRTVTQVVTNTVAQKFDWSSVESDDYKKYIANLRSIGCPEETIRDIITADVNKL